MAYAFDEAARARMEEYIDGIGDILSNKRRRASFASYFMGLLGDGERKSVEPMAARAAADPEETRAMTERLLHFVADAKWDDQRVRQHASRHAMRAMTAQEPVDSWIVDDTGFAAAVHRFGGQAYELSDRDEPHAVHTYERARGRYGPVHAS